MNKEQRTCLDAYLKMFNGTEFEYPSFYEATSYINVGVIKAIKQNGNETCDKENIPEVYMAFGRNIGYKENLDEGEFNVLLQFTNLNKKFVASVFDGKNYKYDVISQVINDFYKLGKNYGLFAAIETIQDPAIHHYFKKAYQFRGTSKTLVATERKISEIEFTDFFKTKNNTSNGRLSRRRITINYRIIIKDGEIHPLALITFPISMNDNISISVDVHPSGKSVNDRKISEAILRINEKLKERIDMILRKELKLKNKFLETLSFEDKLNYLKVAEMAII